MEITRILHPDEVHLRLNGRMDATWSDTVAGALADCVRSGQHNLVVDMAAVDYVSSAGIRTLVLYARQLRSIQGRFRVINPSDIVRKVLELAGLDALLITPAAGPPAAAQRAAHPSITVALAETGATADVWSLDSQATLHVRWLGRADDWLAGRASPKDCILEPFPATTLGLGLGGLVSGETPSIQPLGEFLAAAGAAVCQPADGSQQPDYMLVQGALVPAVQIAYGLIGQGSFRQLVRFDKGPDQPSLPLSSVVKACLDASGTDAIGLVIVAETAAMIGASLQRSFLSPDAAGPTRDVFAFPHVRDWLGFTAEPAFKNSTSLIVGFAARQSRGAELRLLRPMRPALDLDGHFHAAALPYRPLRKGRVDLAETVRGLFETEQVLGVLHLLNDWRELSGAGESRLLRGACWGAPLTW